VNDYRLHLMQSVLPLQRSRLVHPSRLGRLSLGLGQRRRVQMPRKPQIRSCPKRVRQESPRQQWADLRGKGSRFHDLRHTAATILLLANVHPKIVSERLGHASIEITLNTYSHALPTLQRDAADKLDGVFTSNCSQLAPKLPATSDKKTTEVAVTGKVRRRSSAVRAAAS